MSELPTIKEELTRKALDTLEGLERDRKSGIITEAQYAVGVDVLWGTVAGLVDKDFIELISLTAVKKSDRSFLRRALLVNAAGVVVSVILFPQDYSIVVRTFIGGRIDRKQVESDTMEKALEKYNLFLAKLRGKGYDQFY